jgi:ribonuclease HIII
MGRISCTVAEDRPSPYDVAKFVKPITLYTCKLTSDQADELEAHLNANNFESHEIPYARFAGKKGKLNVVFYTSGKMVAQGKDTQEFVEFVLEPLILKEAKLGYEGELNPELLMPRLGIDESGKGDFFGPMVAAGVYVNADITKKLKAAGVQDSKNIKSQKKMAELARVIREMPGCVSTVVPIGNESYNRLHRSMRTVNAMLAWAHARVIENLMGQRHRMKPPPERAISDQFAATKSVVAKALMSMGQEIELVQRHKAEADLAVAAASILARDEFVSRLKKLGDQFEMELPKGASAAVVKAGEVFVAKYGAEELPKVAKMHFRTSYKVRGLPEPPKVDWKRKGR